MTPTKVIVGGLVASAAAMVTAGVARLAAPVSDAGVVRSAAAANLMSFGQSLRDDIARVVRPAVDRTRMLAADPELVAAMRAGDAGRQSAACDRAVTQSTEVDAVAVFDAGGQIRAINTVYADGRPIPRDRVDRILKMSFDGRSVVQRCSVNGADDQALEF
jgi:hypothetical protein